MKAGGVNGPLAELVAAYRGVMHRYRYRHCGRPGHIAAAARALGVNRSHLYRVVQGERESRRLLGLYLEWREGQRGIRRVRG